MLTTGGVVSVNGRKLCPRIILMTDGKPTDENCQDGQQVRTSKIINGKLSKGARRNKSCTLFGFTSRLSNSVKLLGPVGPSSNYARGI